jgi:hypothetical protein
VSPVIVFRSGSHRDDNFTPRPGIDTEERPATAPGLSTFTTLEQAVQPGEKAQAIDLERLLVPLRGIPDDAEQGGTPGHVSITPVDSLGAVDQQRLQEWAAYRRTGRQHPFTRIVLEAIVELDVRRQR